MVKRNDNNHSNDDADDVSYVHFEYIFLAHEMRNHNILHLNAFQFRIFFFFKYLYNLNIAILCMRKKVKTTHLLKDLWIAFFFRCEQSNRKLF